MSVVDVQNTVVVVVLVEVVLHAIAVEVARPCELIDAPVVVVVFIVTAGAGAIAALIGAGLGKLNEALTVLPMIVVAIFFLWLLVTQKFLIQVSLLGTPKAINTIGSGVNGVNPNWWMVLWLGIVEGVIHSIAALFSYGGLLVVVPVVLCISTAAYRQLFGPEDRTGLLS